MNDRKLPRCARAARLILPSSAGTTPRLFLSFVFLLGSTLRAQVNTGSLSGLVRDPCHAAISGTAATVLSTETGYTRVTNSLGSGAYTLPNLPIGKYTLSATAPGFSRTEELVSIGVEAQVRLDLRLSVGTLDQTVEVTVNGSNLQRDDASISTLATSDVIADTPLYLRNWNDLLRTVPGVQVARYTNQSGGASAGQMGDLNVNGVHSLQNHFILDGIDNNTFS